MFCLKSFVENYWSRLDDVILAKWSDLGKHSISKLVNFFAFSKNSRLFKRYAKLRRNSDFAGSGVILVENRTWITDIWALLHFVPHLSALHKAKTLTYNFRVSRYSFNLKERIKHKFSLINAFAPSRLHQFYASPEVSTAHADIMQSLTSGNLSKAEFEDFKYRDIQIGDIIYDEFLRTKSEVTLDFSSPSFVFFASTILQFCDKLLDFFQLQNVKAVVVSHHNYRFALPARVALMHGIETYRLDLLGLVKMSASKPNSYLNAIEDLRTDLESLSIKERIQGQHLAKENLQARLKGNVEDLGIKKHEVFPINEEEIKLNFDTEKTVILVALHDFHDAVHAYGSGFYPDFAMWLEDIGRLTEGKNVTCLIKPHPYQRWDVRNYLEGVCDRFTHFRLISPYISNLRLASWGLRHCLTVYGSIAHELPYLGVSVINASTNNPHRSFGFSYTPKDLEEYRSILGSLDTFEFKPDLSSLLDYYLMRFIIGRPSWILQNLSEVLNLMGSISNPDYEKFLSYFLANVKLEPKCTEQAVYRFIKSNDFSFKQRHFDTNDCVKPESCYCQSIPNLGDILSSSAE